MKTSSTIRARSLMGFVDAARIGAPKGMRFACVPFVGNTSWHATEQAAVAALVALNPSSRLTRAGVSFFEDELIAVLST